MTALKFNADLKLATQTLAAIDAALSAKAEDGFRAHLGASLIGRSCERALWFSFRWARQARFEPRILRLFARGQREEDVIASLLRGAGINMMQVDPNSGNQFRFSDCGGHFGGSMDGACVGVPDAPKTWHVWECKTFSNKTFQDLTTKGVKESKSEHYDQMQLYMHWAGIERALYTAVNKDNDALHIERINYDKSRAEALISKAQRIIDAPTPPERIGGADWYECKWCDHNAICHGIEAPAVNCRTCAHSTPKNDGTWMCEPPYPVTHVLSLAEQKQGCVEHRFIPHTIAHWAEVVSADHEENIVVYKHIKTGWEFMNGPGPDGFSSKEIHASADKAGLGMVANDESLMNLRKQFGGEIVG